MEEKASIKLVKWKRLNPLPWSTRLIRPSGLYRQGLGNLWLIGIELKQMIDRYQEK